MIFGGLYFSYSQSSLLVLFGTVLAVSVLLAERPSRNVVIAVAAAVTLAASAVGIASVKDDGLTRATSGRTRLVSVTGHVIANHPIAGVGIGSQPLAAKQELETRRRAAKNASHTTPLTVLAELGAVGFLLYLAFLAGAAKLLWEAFGRHRLLGLGLAASFLVLFLHSLFYSGFFEDPVMWGALGVAAMVVAVAWCSVPRTKPTRSPTRRCSVEPCRKVRVDDLHRGERRQFSAAGHTCRERPSRSSRNGRRGLRPSPPLAASPWLRLRLRSLLRRSRATTDEHGDTGHGEDGPHGATRIGHYSGRRTR